MRVGGKKRNPRTVPVSKADVKRAYDDGANEGIKMFLDVALLTFNDMNMSDEFVTAFNYKFNRNLAAHLSKTISTHDIRQALKDEKGWSVEVVD